MNAFTEDQLERQLSARLHHELSEMEPPQDLAATMRRRYTRHTWTVRAMTGAPVIAAVAVLAAVALSTNGSTPGGVTPDGSTVAGAQQASPEVKLDVRLVAERTTTALGNLNDYVQHYHEVARDPRIASVNGTVTDGFVDATTERERSDTSTVQGALQASVAKTGFLSGPGVVVDYTRNVWYYDQFGRAQASPGSDTSGVIEGAIYDPAVISQAQAAGTLVLVGAETLDGNAVLHLRWNPFAGFTLDLWVDSTTYLPHRYTAVGVKEVSTVDYEWLPRTPANLAHLELTPPAGMPQGQPERPGRR